MLVTNEADFLPSIASVETLEVLLVLHGIVVVQGLKCPEGDPTLVPQETLEKCVVFHKNVIHNLNTERGRKVGERRGGERDRWGKGRGGEEEG